MAASGDDKPIGIDLGTTTSGIARLERGQPEMILSETREYTIPSVVGFTANERLVGRAAFDQAGENPANTVYEVKRLVGKTMHDATIKKDIKKWPFTVEAGENGKPQVRVSYRNKNETFYPEQISAMILSKLKVLAGEFYRSPITKAVITVPAAFTDAQRQATIDAGRMAGLEVLRIINEPTAAAIAYGYTNQIQKEENRRVLVFDLGGGTFDVSILTMKRGEYQVLSTLGDSHLGGGDVDTRLLEHFEGKLTGFDLQDNPRSKWRLRMACEKAKKQLSREQRGFIELDNLVDGHDFHSNITRAAFEELCDDLFSRTISITKKCLEDAKLEASDIHDVVMVGGSTRIPKIHELVADLFGEEKIRQSINPDEAVAQGAVLQAALLMKTPYSEVNDLVVRDQIPRSLGIEVKGHKTSHIIKRGEVIPTRNTEQYVTVHDNQTTVRIAVLEGESLGSTENTLLDEYSIPVPAAPAGHEEIDVTFTISENSVLEVMARSVTTGKGSGIIIQRARKQFTDDEINRHRQTETEMQNLNQQQAERSERRNALESFAYRLRKIPSLRTMCDGVLEWLASNPNAGKWLIDDRIAEFERMEATRKLAREEHERRATSLRSHADMRTACDAVLAWIDKNRDTASEEEFQLKLQDLDKPKEPPRALTRLKNNVNQTMQKYSGIPAVQEKCKELQGWLDECDYSTDDATFWDKMEELTNFVQACLHSGKPKEPPRALTRLRNNVNQTMQKYSGIPAVQEKCKELQGWLEKCDYNTGDATFWDKIEGLADFVQDCLLDHTMHKEAEQETKRYESSDIDDD